MHFLRRRLGFFTWIALVAMLGLGVLPAVSHALAGAGGSDDWAEVCTASGLKRVAADGSPAESGGLPELGAMLHCPYCAPGTPAAGPPPARLLVCLAPVAVAAEPQAVHLLPVPVAIWAAAQPRGPPASD